MSETKFTPGPWKAWAGYVFAPGDGGGNICAMSEPRADQIVGYTRPDYNTTAGEEIEANTCLVVAAPTMHAALVYIAERSFDRMIKERAVAALEACTPQAQPESDQRQGEQT
jgi:hypothetical protein